MCGDGWEGTGLDARDSPAGSPRGRTRPGLVVRMGEVDVCKVLGESIHMLRDDVAAQVRCPLPAGSFHASTPPFMLCFSLKHPSAFCLLGLLPGKNP